MSQLLPPRDPARRPRDRALYLAALAVGLAEAGRDDGTALAELREASADRAGDLRAARRRLYTSSLGSCDARREADRLLQLAVPAPRRRRPRPH
jgi:hypothetical protein